jgi:phosphoglycerate dehydrogenase-like enzyme
MTRHIIAPEWVVAGFQFPSDVEVTFCDNLVELSDDVIATGEYIVLPYLGDPESIKAAIPRMKNVKIIQTLTAGFDNVMPHLPAGVTLCNAAGVHDDSTSELALALTLAAQRDLPRSIRAQDRGEWLHFFSPALADKEVLLVGYGGVGKAVEKRLLAFECSVVPVATSARDHVHAISELSNLIPSADIIILTVPLNDQTRNLVDAEFISKMKPNALLVNVARGPVVNTEALLEALSAGKIRAALDVTNPEPLPADHPLWSAKNCLITSHLGGETDIFERRARKRIHRQLELWAAGRPLECVVSGS